MERGIRPFSALQPRAQGRLGPARFVAIAEAKATTPAPAPARVVASTSPRARAKVAHPTFQEGKVGKEEAKARARAMAKAMAKAKERFQTWMIKDGHM